MNQTDFELCSYSISPMEKCDNYGALHCKSCDRYYCDSHKCLHLIAYFTQDYERCEESSHATAIDLPLEFTLWSIGSLNKYRDELFRALKIVQREIDLRESSAATIARETSTANLDKWLKEQGYEHISHGKQNHKRNSRGDKKSRFLSTQRINHSNNRLQSKQRDRSIKETIEVLFNSLTEGQIKAFVQRYGK